jgi:2-iminobutanoate/2-iminopropanoate deaminase
MKREIKHPEKLVSTGSYSAAVECDGWLFVSGHAAQNLATGEVVHGTIEEEARLTLSHIGTVLAQAGCTFGDVVKGTCYLADINDFEEFDKTYREFFTGVKPARTIVQSVLGEAIKVDAIARVPRGR